MLWYNRLVIRGLAWLLQVCIVAACFVLSGCAGSGGTGSAVTSLVIKATSPGGIVTETPSVVVGETQQFVAFVTGGGFPAITWSVDGAPASGTISSTGLFTAPATPGTYTVRAQLTNNPAVSDSVQIVVAPGIEVTISSPSPVPLAIPLSKVDFDAVVTGSSNQAVSWSVQEPNGGSISSAGLYTAPSSPGTYTVVATSMANATKKDTIQVEVIANAKVRFTIEGLGTFDVTLGVSEAPNTCANFVSLVNQAFYDGIYFHRYEDLDLGNMVGDFIVQGGDPLTKTLSIDDPSIGTGGPGYTIAFETSVLTHDKYAVAMARSMDPNSAGSQFYICLDAVHALDGNYVVFGNVTFGQAVADQLRKGDKIESAVIVP